MCGYSQDPLGCHDPPDSPNCPPALASAPSLLLPNCMSESRVRGDMGRSMLLLKEVLSEGGREKNQKPPESVPGQSSPIPPLPPTGPRAWHSQSQELSRGKGPQEGKQPPAVRAASWSLAQPPRSLPCPGWEPHGTQAESRQRWEGHPPQESLSTNAASALRDTPPPGTLTE